jgi:hypothetical protein
MYRTAERPYYHQGCWEGVKGPEVRYEQIKATVCNSGGDEFEINVDYYVVGEIVTVTAYDKLVGLSDVEYDIREAIRASERKSFDEINFAG